MTSAACYALQKLHGAFAVLHELEAVSVRITEPELVRAVKAEGNLRLRPDAVRDCRIIGFMNVCNFDANMLVAVNRMAVLNLPWIPAKIIEKFNELTVSLRPPAVLSRRCP